MGTAWELVPISDLGTTITGRTPPTARPEFFGDTFPFITPTDMKGQRTIRSTERGISMEGAAFLKGKRLPPGSVAVSCIGWQLGKVAVVSTQSFSNQQLNVILPNSRVRSGYLFYHLSTRREEIRSLGSIGTRTPILKKSAFERLMIPLPPLAVQDKIASILSPYDDLIENNQARVKLLTEMARRIYREWFVEFRYPGCEAGRLANSEPGAIPNGWTIRPFSALGEYVNGHAFKPEDWGPEGTPIIKIRELKNGVTKDTPRYSGDISKKYLIRDGDLLFSWSADLDAYLWTGGPGWLNQHLFRIDPAPGVPTAFLFHALKERMPEFRTLAQGTTMHHIKRSALHQVTTVLPPESITKAFADLVAPLDRLNLELVRTTHNLRATRDLLLPQLMSGEIDVSDLNIAMPEAAA